MATNRRQAPDRLHEGLQRLGIHPQAWDRYRGRVRSGGEGRPSAALRVDASTVYLEGPIVAADDEWVMGWLGIDAYITAGGVRAALDTIEGDAVLAVNSPGGDVFEASAIVDALLQREEPVDMRVTGLAASAAAGLMLFCRRVECSPMSMVMLHRAWTGAWGNALELAAVARLLGQVDGQLADAMAQRVESLDRAAALAILDGPEGQDGTWYTAAEAVEAGLAEAVTGTDEPAPAAARDDGDAEMMGRMRARMRAAFATG